MLNCILHFVYHKMYMYSWTQIGQTLINRVFDNLNFLSETKLWYSIQNYILLNEETTRASRGGTGCEFTNHSATCLNKSESVPMDTLSLSMVSCSDSCLVILISSQSDHSGAWASPLFNSEYCVPVPMDNCLKCLCRHSSEVYSYKWILRVL